LLPQIIKPNFFIITGCSGGGKSTLLTALRQSGFHCVEESGRSIVRQQIAINGHAIPTKDCHLLCELILSHNMHNFESALEIKNTVFFDRGIPEAISIAPLLDKTPHEHHLNAAKTYRYNKKVFLLPPWKEIFKQDSERLHTFDDALREYEAHIITYQDCGYELVEVPKCSVQERVLFIKSHL
jgi:predicted ATPase